MSISAPKHASDGEAAPARRIEIFAGAGRRRSRTAQEKAAIIAESLAEGVRACRVARRHGLTPQQLFTWRRGAREKARQETGASLFAPAVAETMDAAVASAAQVDGKTAAARPPIIELDIDGASVRIWRGAGDGDRRRLEGVEAIGPTGAVKVIDRLGDEAMKAFGVG